MGYRVTEITGAKPGKVGPVSAYIIVKGSRLKDNYTTRDAYKGPTCQTAGVPEGWVYTDRNLASLHAQLLTKFNPVGFVVVDVKFESE